MSHFIKHRITFLFLLKKICKNWIYSILCVYGIVKSKKIICQLRNGMKIRIPKHPSNLEVIIENWLPECGVHYFSIFKEIVPKSVMIDIGANIGTFTLYMAEKQKKLKIFCYEPDEENFKCLKENFEINQFHTLYAYNLAVGSQNKPVKIYAKNSREMGTPGSSILHKTNKFKTVDCVTLQNILDDNKIFECDLLKLDCEGAEYDILLSQGENCFKRIKAIILEYHEFESLNFNHHDLENHLQKFGFHVESYAFHDRCTGIMKATKT